MNLKCTRLKSYALTAHTVVTSFNYNIQCRFFVSTSRTLTCRVFHAADPAKQCHQLAAITHTQTECVTATTEFIKLSSDAVVEAYSSSPTYKL